MTKVLTQVYVDGEVDDTKTSHIGDTWDVREVEESFDLMWAYVDDEGHGFIRAEILTHDGSPVATVTPFTDDVWPMTNYTIAFGDDESMADFVFMAMGETLFSALHMGLDDEFMVNITVA